MRFLSLYFIQGNSYSLYGDTKRGFLFVSDCRVADSINHATCQIAPQVDGFKKRARRKNMAEFEFKCPKCKQFIVAEESYRGQVAQCPYCGRNIAIPGKQSAIGKKDPVEKTGFWRGIRRKYFSSKGRLTRDEFRRYLGVTCLFDMIWIILCAIAALLSKSGCVSLARVVAPIVMVIAMVIMPIVLCANCSLLFVMIRRLQDINRSQWWLLALIVGMQYCRLSGIDWSGGSLYVGGIVLGAWILVLTILDGTPGRNDYGDDPKGRPSKGNYKDKSKLIITTLSACSIIIPVIATFIILQKSIAEIAQRFVVRSSQSVGSGNALQ